MKRLRVVAMIAGIGAAVYELWLRARLMRWGATDDEVGGPYPGAELSTTPLSSPGRETTPRTDAAGAFQLDLYWIPLGAGQHVVRVCGALYEAIVAFIQRRPRRPLFHTALVATTPVGHVFVEMTPVPDDRGKERGVVGEGCVGTRLGGKLRVFRYEIRRWVNGVIPDLDHAIGGPVRLTDEPSTVLRVLDLVPAVPRPVWGRDELRAGEMWNSNSVVAWLIATAGIESAAGAPPENGRAPGWDAGLIVAKRIRREVRVARGPSSRGRPDGTRVQAVYGRTIDDPRSSASSRKEAVMAASAHALDAPIHARRARRNFARHFVEMVVAMFKAVGG